MKILLLTTRLNLGGIGIYTTSLAKALKKRGEEVVVASSSGRLLKRLKTEGIEYIDLPIDTSADIGIHTISSCIKLSRVIREKNIDLIHAQTRVTQVIAQLLANKRGLPFVSTCHGFFKRRLGRRLFPCWGNRVIAISDAVREHLVNDMGLAKDRVRLIYNGIDLSRFSRIYSEDDKVLIRKEYGIKNLPTVGIISRLSDVKGYEYLLAAIARLLPRIKDIQLLIIGDGPVAYLEKLKRLTKDLRIEDRVVFHGACEDTSIPLAVIDLFCMPSIQEGLGLAILEAMAMALPVVASDAGGIYSLIRHEQNGILVPPKETDSLAEAIFQLLSDKSMASKMGALSKDIVNKKFTLDIMADQIKELYREVIG